MKKNMAMNRTDMMLRKALKKISMLESRCNEMEKKLGMIGDYTHLSLDRPEEIKRDADGKLLDKTKLVEEYDKSGSI